MVFDIIANARVMSNYRIAFACLACIFSLVAANASHAQQEANTYTIQFLPMGENGAVVNHEGFPATEARFLILDDGSPIHTAWPEDKILVLEDDQKVSAEYDPYKQPIDTTVVYHYTEYTDIESGGSHREVMDELVANLKQETRLRSLCLTMVSVREPVPCRPPGTGETLGESFKSRTDYSRTEVTNSIRPISSQLIWDSIIAERVPNRPHLVIWVVDDDILTHDDMPGDLLPATSDQLTRLRDADISLIVLDLTPADDLLRDEQWKGMLKTFNILHLKYAGTNYLLNDTKCGPAWFCVKQELDPKRPMVHVLRYNSSLFVDGAQHSLRVQLQSGDLGGNAETASSIIAHERTDFIIAPPYQNDHISLRSEVRFFSRAFNAIAMIVLMLVLVLIKRPQDGSV